MSEPDHRDLVIEALARSEAELLERLAHLESLCESYRALSVTALGALHDLTLTCAGLRAQRRQLKDDYRALRTRLLQDHAA